MLEETRTYHVICSAVTYTESLLHFVIRKMKMKTNKKEKYVFLKIIVLLNFWLFGLAIVHRASL